MKRNGFTLIELLVVIAIIGLLSSIVLASVESARAKARDAKRMADLNQIRTALELFYDDNGRYPTENSPDNASGTSIANSGGLIGPEGSSLNSLPDGTGASNANTSRNIGEILDLYMGERPTDPLNTDGYYYYYDGKHLCGGHNTQAIVYIRKLETRGGNFGDTICSSYGGEGGNTEDNNAYVIVLGEGLI